MSFYNMLFGMNPQSGLLLAAVGLRECDVERFRDVHVEDEGRTIAVYTRTGGNNREDYTQETLYANPYFKTTRDDSFDNTYATFYFKVPEEFVGDVAGLADVLTNGLRREFCEHLAKTLRREPTEADKNHAAYEAESAVLKRTNHIMANGHTFVPYDDRAMEKALELAEANGGALRTAWGIAPLRLTVKTNVRDYTFHRVDIGYEWVIDETYWQHCQETFAAKYPVSMAKIAESVRERLTEKAG